MEIPYTITARPDTGLYNGKLGIWLFLASEVMLFGALFTAYLFMRLGAEPGLWPAHVLSIPLGLFNTGVLITSSITMVYAWVALKERKFNQYLLFLGATILCGIVFLGVKGYEYKTKYDHWGFKIKDEVFASKYQDELTRRDIEVTAIPSQHAFQVSGDLESEDKTNYVFTPVKTFHPINYTPPAGAEVEPAGGGEKTFTVAKADIIANGAGNFLPKYGTYFAIYFTVTGLHALHIIGGVIVMLYFLTIGSRLYTRNPEQLTNRIEVTGIFWHFVDLVWITVFPILYLT